MTLVSFATLFNVGAVAMVLTISWIVSRVYSLPFFTSWLRGYTTVFCVLVCSFFPIDFNPFLGLLTQLFVLIGAGFFFQTGFLIQGKKPGKILWKGIMGAFLFCVVLVLAGVSPKSSILLPFLVSCASSVFLGYLFLFRVRLLNHYVSVFWLGIPLFLVFTSSLFYSFIPADFRWVGYAIASALHLLIGTGMVVFLMEKNQERVLQLNEEKLSLEREKVVLQQTQIEALEEANRIKEEFLSVVSHEMRTPINVIQGFTSALDREMMGAINDKQRESLSRIMGGSRRLLELVNNILDVARFKSGQFVLAWDEIYFPDTVEEVLDLLHSLGKEKGIEFKSDLDVPMEVSLDEQRIVQVLTNLISNAVKFTPQGGQVIIKAFTEDDCLVTEVIDTGIGISEEDLPKLFVPFKQIDMTSTRKYDGSGLGLSIAKSIVEAHEGQIGVRSVPGEGSTFWFKIPLAPAVSQ